MVIDGRAILTYLIKNILDKNNFLLGDFHQTNVDSMI